MRVDVIANASHELRTPLASLLGFVETLQGPARDDAKARERFLPIMREQAGRMARLIDDLLSLSRAELRAHQQPTALIDMGAIIREILDSLGLSARERGVALAMQLPDEPMMIRGDRDDLLRLVENLVENGIRYGRDGKAVTISLVRGPGGEVILSVRDHGPGIAAEHIPRLTERFYRADVSHSREIGGTGLGLAIVKHLVMRHRARLEIESRLGEGADFKVLFPPYGG
jgi:two-component system phosphate regulon sensor histidine kinase PhoR